MIKRLRFSVSEATPLLERLFPFVPFVPLEFVVVEVSMSLERSERIDEEDDDELVPELDEPDELGELYVLG
ncbi:hypothetical protein J3D53_002630 [Klebsiella aerogenes]|nr:hypothetical protein [Klebsiella aerogenes]